MSTAATWSTTARCGTAGGMQVPVSSSGCEALVPEMHGQGSFVPEDLGEGLRLGRLRALVPGHIQRIADDDLGAGELPDEALQGFQVLLAVGADQSQDGLGSQAKRVGDSDADPAVADIQAHDAGKDAGR
jgi:hypothetical protein